MLRKLALSALAGASFGAIDALLVMQGGLPLLIGNAAALWLTLGFFAGRLGRPHPAHCAGLGIAAESLAVVAFYAVKAANEGFPLVLAGIWLLLALISGAVMGLLAAGTWQHRPRWGVLALGLVWCLEPGGWTLISALRGAPARWSGPEVYVWVAEIVVGLVLLALALVPSKPRCPHGAAGRPADPT